MSSCVSRRLAILGAALAAVACPVGSVHGQTEILPDLFFDGPEMLDNEIDTTTMPGTVLFRFSTSMPNVGLGEFRLEATGVDSGDGRETVNQRIFRDDGTSFLVDAGDFVWNPQNSRMESDSWVEYRLREILPGDGVGPTVGTGGKTSVVITSSALYDGSLPNVPNSPFFASGRNHGISVGYTDLYPKFLSFQWVDVTGLLSGEYWLEAEIDVGGNIMESDTTNNLTRIKVQVNMPDADGDGLSDSFEQNIGLDPNRADSDGDGLNDEGEVGFDGDLQNYDPFDPVSNPGGTDTDALDVDSDDDGFRDGVEVWLGTGALDNGDFPTGLPVSGGFPLAALGIALGCIAGRALRAGAHG